MKMKEDSPACKTGGSSEQEENKIRKDEHSMKKLLALVLAMVMVLSMTACGSAPAASTPATTAPAAAPAATEAAGEAKELTLADVWPDGSTVYIDVPSKAGGGTDLFTRIIVQALQETYPNVNYVVTNYDTAEVGAEHAKNAEPNGLNLTVAACTNMDNWLSGMSNVNPNEDLVVVGKVNDGGPQAIIARPDAPYKNLTELGEYIAEHPGEVIVGCSLGGTSQLILRSIIASLGEGYEDMVTYVQCAAEADKLTQTASGSIDIANCSIPNGVSYEADGKLTILGSVGPRVGTLEAMSELTGIELPETFKAVFEQGIDFSWDAGYFLMAPAGTPDAVCEVINAAIREAAQQPSFDEGMRRMASFPNVPDLATCRADWAKEWEFQNEVMTGMGLNVR